MEGIFGAILGRRGLRVAAEREPRQAVRVDEDALVRQLQDLERHMGGETDPGACRAELAGWRAREAEQEFRVSVPSGVVDAVLLGVCLRYGVEPYRAPRQKSSTVTVRVPLGFMKEVLGPLIQAATSVIDRATFEAATRVVERWSGVSLKDHL